MLSTTENHPLKFSPISFAQAQKFKPEVWVVPFSAEQGLPVLSSLPQDLAENLAKWVEKLGLRTSPRSVWVGPSLSEGAPRVLLMALESKTLKALEESPTPPKFDWQWESILAEPIRSWMLLPEALPQGRARLRWLFRACLALEGQHDESHDFRKFRKNRPFQGQLREVFLASENSEPELAALLKRFEGLYAGLKILKRLANAPSNLCNPTTLAHTAQSLAQRHAQHLQLQLHRQDDLKAMGMGGMLAVGQGSATPPVLIELRYQPEGSDTRRPYVFVGKAVTFDSGGISIKPSAQMHHMKFDMCGGATLFGLMESLVALRCPFPVVALIAACENMPDGASYRPGDIIEMANGLRVEVLNTDAEGRLALADALHYATQNFEAKAIIDLATLTGACGVALGHVRSGLFSSSSEMNTALMQASERSGDRAWAMPMDEDYEASIQTPHADLCNTGKRGGSSITAAKFLSRFVDTERWAHLDIASTAYTPGEHARATGRPLPLLLEYLMPTEGL